MMLWNCMITQTVKKCESLEKQFDYIAGRSMMEITSSLENYLENKEKKKIEV